MFYGSNSAHVWSVTRHDDGMLLFSSQSSSDPECALSEADIA